MLTESTHPQPTPIVIMPFRAADEYYEARNELQEAIRDMEHDVFLIHQQLQNSDLHPLDRTKLEEQAFSLIQSIRTSKQTLEDYDQRVERNYANARTGWVVVILVCLLMALLFL